LVPPPPSSNNNSRKEKYINASCHLSIAEITIVNFGVVRKPPQNKLVAFKYHE
jgi:hypothetical protein